MALEAGAALNALGKAIRDNRKKLNRTQAELAQETGLHRTYITDLERGMRNVSFLTLVKVARGLGVSVGELLHQAEEVARSSGGKNPGFRRRK